MIDLSKLFIQIAMYLGCRGWKAALSRVAAAKQPIIPAGTSVLRYFGSRQLVANFPDRLLGQTQTRN